MTMTCILPTSCCNMRCGLVSVQQMRAIVGLQDFLAGRFCWEVHLRRLVKDQDAGNRALVPGEPLMEAEQNLSP